MPLPATPAGEAPTLARAQHCLINNAGAIPKTHSKTADGVEMTMAIAMGGSYLLTGRLLPVSAAAPDPRTRPPC